MNLDRDDVIVKRVNFHGGKLDVKRSGATLTYNIDPVAFPLRALPE